LVIGGSGGTPKKSNSHYYLNGTIPWLVIGDLNDGVVTQAQTYITEEGLINSSATLLPPNTLLVAMYGSIGKLGITGIECATNQAIAFCLPHEEIVELRFLFHALKHSKDDLTLKSKGVAQKNISQTILKAHQIPLAPLKEQKRIVKKLDNLTMRVDACRDRLAKVASTLKIIRQSIFDAATSGEIAKDWVYTDQPENWQEVNVGDLLVDKPRNGYSPKAVDYETDIRSLALTATTRGYFDPRHIKYIDEDIPENSHLWLEPGDILIQRANSLEYVGISAIYDGPSKGYIYPDLMMKCRANNRVLTDYLYYLLSSSSVRSYFRKNATGTTGNMPKINQKIVLSAPVSIPSVDEQREIIRRVKTLLAHVERLEVYYEHAGLKINKITSSLLSKAFSGELIPQHLKDEPASDLLKRILLLKEEKKSKVAEIQRRKKTAPTIKKSNSSMLKREDIQSDHLSAILRKSGSMQPENLWSSSQLEIDEFYEQLKEEEEKGLLREVRDESESASRLMEAI
jgi:type I restriction enzyme S subunit